MADCCEDKGCEVAALRASHSGVPWIVLPINTLMFLVEGQIGHVPNTIHLDKPGLDFRVHRSQRGAGHGGQGL
jgi:hypothetical protein